MHRCLLNTDIQDRICELLLRQPPSLPVPSVVVSMPLPRKILISSKSTAALARLARTCQAFHDKAIEKLWHDQYDLVPLLKCFPEDLWQLHETDQYEDYDLDDPRILSSRRTRGPLRQTVLVSRRVAN